MQIFDITQELFHCEVYPGDPAPEYQILHDMQNGALYNLSSFHMSSHNGTHIDAPAHFIADGKTVDQITIDHFVGPCYVTYHNGDITAEDARIMLHEAEKVGAPWRILIGGKATVTEEAAEVFASKPLLLIGNESQTIGPENAPMAVHLILLRAEVVLLEGIRLTNISPGRYLMNAAPLNLGGLEGAPCRAWLMKD